MNRTLIALALTPIFALSAPTFSADAPAPIPAKPADAKAPKPKVEVCFVLDTTGSMGGLIEGAKAKIWAIANTIVKQKPTPEVRFALIAYRDRGDEYVTQRFDLTDDIDTVFKNLQSFKADGGGDTPESVNQALDEAVTKVTWSADKSVLKIIFLVGDAPPHMDYKDDRKFPEICKDAIKKDLIINTIQCGEIDETAPIWKQIAQSSEGEYAAIAQTGNVTVVSAPQDAELAKLNSALGTTLVPCATNGRTWDMAQKEVSAKQSASEAAPAAIQADRLAYNGATGRTVQVKDGGTVLLGGQALAGETHAAAGTVTFSGSGERFVTTPAFTHGGGEIELIDGIANGTLKLADLKDEQLSPEMRKMTSKEREAYVAAKQKERTEIQTKIAELAKAREAYIAEETKKRIAASAEKGDSFDDNVARTIARQAEAKKK